MSAAAGPHKSSTDVLIRAMYILAGGGDGTVNEAMREAAQRLRALQTMVQLAYPIIKAQHGADHMMDGFKPRALPEIDGLLAAFEFEMPLVEGGAA